VGPARVTEESMPARCSASARRRLYFVLGTEVRPSFARLAFWRCEHILTSDKVGMMMDAHLGGA